MSVNRQDTIPMGGGESSVHREVGTCQVYACTQEGPTGEEGEGACGVVGVAEKTEALEEKVGSKKDQHQTQSRIEFYQVVAPMFEAAFTHSMRP